MELLKVEQDRIIAKKNDKVNYWYLVQEGCVLQKFDFSEVKLDKNSIIGILEQDRYLCDYIAGEDTVLAAFTCGSSEELKNLLAGQEKLCNIFLRAAIEQRHQMLCLYSELYTKTRQFHTFVETSYNEYKTLCGKFRIEERNFLQMEHFKPLNMQHKAEHWEVNNSVSIVKKYLQEYLQLMEKDENLTVGAIMEASAQMRRFSRGIGEMEDYLAYNKDILIGESEKDLFRLFFDLAIHAHEKKFDIEPVKKQIALLIMFTEKINIYNMRMVARRVHEYKNYDFEVGNESGENSVISKDKVEIDITATDCVAHILEYAGYKDDEAERISQKINEYRNMSDMLATDNESIGLRKQLTAIFYDVYYRVFIRAVKNEKTLTPILEMFLNFGFMDVKLVGEEHAQSLYNLCAHLDVCRSKHVYTIYQWLKSIYNGKNEPSKNEFDLNYPAYLADLQKNGKLTPEQVEDYRDNRKMRVEFEIKNMFPAVNRATYGKISTFCPILCEMDLINSIDKMLVTADRLDDTMNELRKIDYSVFYREVMFSDTIHGINSEMIMKEILPDIILMPNAGTKGIMWQETAGVRSDTSARFMFPIFTAVDLEDLMLETVGRYRWEMCRKVEGIRWNDVREKSLTAEFCTYMQFYRKNHDLSMDAKEKIKLALGRAKSNYREVFVKDYESWVKFESKGSFRLNKVSRDILVRYCPFTKSIRTELKANPIYQNSIQRFEAETSKKLQRYNGVYDKYVKAGGEITSELKENLMFYQM